MVVVSDEAGVKQKEILTDWPFEEGLILGTTKLKDDSLLVAEHDLTSEKDRIGIRN